MDKAGTLVLVGCVRSKQPYEARAEKLYTSALFHKRVSFARTSGQKGRPLCAVQRGRTRADTGAFWPYDITFNALSVRQRRAWEQQVYEQLQVHLPSMERAAVLAGARYAEFLQVPLENQGLMVLHPQVQAVGWQQTWLEQAVASRWQT